MSFIQEVKQSLRVKTTTYDKEIASIIEAGKQDLQVAGVETIKEDDPLTKRALILYAKAEFDYLDESEKWWTAYARLRNTMAIAGEYKQQEGEAGET